MYIPCYITCLLSKTVTIIPYENVNDNNNNNNKIQSSFFKLNWKFLHSPIKMLSYGQYRRSIIRSKWKNNHSTSQLQPSTRKVCDRHLILYIDVWKLRLLPPYQLYQDTWSNRRLTSQWRVFLHELSNLFFTVIIQIIDVILGICNVSIIPTYQTSGKIPFLIIDWKFLKIRLMFSQTMLRETHHIHNIYHMHFHFRIDDNFDLFG